jgi:hypothetical protein
VIKKPDLYDSIDVKQPLEAGGYIMQIVHAEYVPSKNYIVLNLDIFEGAMKGYFSKKVYNDNWSSDAKKYLSLNNTQGAVKALKADITAIERSNNFVWDWQTEKSLIGKKVGAIFGKEQYQANDGTLKFKTKLKFLRSVETIISGDYEIPEPTYLDLSEAGSNDYLESTRAVASFLEEEKKAKVFEVSEDDLPF